MRATLLPSTLLVFVFDWANAASPSLSPSTTARSFLGDALVRQDPVQNVLDHQTTRVSSCQQKPTGPIEMTMCDYETVESVNEELYEQLHALVRTPFFKYFRVDLYRDCPFWDENILCVNEDCRIVTVDENEIPVNWRAESLSKLEQPQDENLSEFPGCYQRNSDFCYLDDVTEGDYVDLSLNPERFTGYNGPSSRRVWEAIYQENCFGQSELSLMNQPYKAAASLPDTLLDPLRAQSNIDPVEDQQCVEKRVYYKIISGLHASISTHICYEMLNKTTGEWVPDLQCFVSRVASHPERLQYIYFNTVLLLRAVARLGSYLSAYDYCASATHDEHTITIDAMRKVIDIATATGKFDETVLFRGSNADVLKQEFKEHFRNVTRIMDCVGCDKCRLWGKVQTTGVATALKVLFEMDEKALDPKSNVHLLSRGEVVALMNALHRFTESLHAVELFRMMWREASEDESEALKREAENALRQPQPSPRAGADRPPAQNLFEELQWRLESLLKMCKDSTVECVGLIMGAAETFASTIGSLFRMSGKEDGPRSDL
ncbi:hypothetical protein K488DRAFT_79364 [Vararia minispora EC-137]|uniref:Uncharacterized protein n=1 Tax=Vararia minispora EC-137 TaxID=1314806 RepID=A0ACB8QH18_9AGAM|nr:hypothetical protein K488DRAFT_79364 [Vararia minispora EC-137]